MKFIYDDLVSRNAFFISYELQQTIRSTRLVFAGCGLSSNIAIAAARLGFEHFTLIDGDSVDISNLNRQAFYHKQVSKNKAEATADLVYSINPESKIEVLPLYITPSDVRSIVAKGDIIINTVDFNEATYLINDTCAESGKLSVSPMNIGFGIIVLVFSSTSARLSDIVGGITTSNIDFLKALSSNLRGYEMPSYLADNLQAAFDFYEKYRFFPQNVVASLLNAGMIAMLIVDYIAGGKIKMAPEPIYLDAPNYLRS